MKKRLLALLFLAALLTLKTDRLEAEQSASQISPTSLEFETSPSNPYQTSEIYLFNPSLSEAQKMDITVKDLTVVDELGTYSFVNDPESRFAISQWTEITPKNVTLGPQEVQILNLKTTPPKDVEPGGHYGIILTTATPEGFEEIPAKGGAIVRTVGGVGAVLMATVPGEISWEGRLLEFLPVSLLNTGPVNFVIRFENQGTVHYSPHGKIEVFDFLGGKVGEVEVKPQRVFPLKTRRLEATWNRLLLVGKYRAKATIYYGKTNEEKTATAEIYFWAFPYKATAALILTIAVLVVISKLRRKIGR